MVAHDTWAVGAAFESHIFYYTDITQLGECYPYKIEVVGASPTIGIVSLAQLVRASDCESEGHGCKSHMAPMVL